MHVPQPECVWGDVSLCAQFYGRGLFGMAPVAWVGGPYQGALGAVRRAALSLPCLFAAALDQPLRSISRGGPGLPARLTHCVKCNAPSLQLTFWAL